MLVLIILRYTEVNVLYAFRKPRKRDEAHTELSVMEEMLYAVVEIKCAKISEDGEIAVLTEETGGY